MIVPIGVFHLARSASSLAAYYEDRLETAGAQDRALSVLGSARSPSGEIGVEINDQLELAHLLHR
jgi:hypothetical protein